MHLIVKKGKNMSEKIVIPVEDKTGLKSKVAQHFGRAPYFVVIELDENGEVSNIKTQPNTGEHMGGVGHPHENILNLKPNVVIAFGMGPGGLQSFTKARIRVLKAEGDTVEKNITSFREGTLEELTAGCEHAHHHGSCQTS